MMIVMRDMMKKMTANKASAEVFVRSQLRSILGQLPNFHAIPGPCIRLTSLSKSEVLYIYRANFILEENIVCVQKVELAY